MYYLRTKPSVNPVKFSVKTSVTDKRRPTKMSINSSGVKEEEISDFGEQKEENIDDDGCVMCSS
jgi:hypothetical protein